MRHSLKVIILLICALNISSCKDSLPDESAQVFAPASAEELNNPSILSCENKDGKIYVTIVDEFLGPQDLPLDLSKIDMSETEVLERIQKSLKDRENKKAERAKELAEQAEKIIELPNDFAIEYNSDAVAVIPAYGDFIKITPVAKDEQTGYLLTYGSTGGNPAYNHRYAKELTQAQCLALYKEAYKSGFFDLKESYSSDMAGGCSDTITLTANGVTKKVTVYGADVPGFYALRNKLSALRR